VGLNGDAKEAVMCALLADAHLRGVPASLPSVTGASGPRVLGTFTPTPGTQPGRARPV
jgi:anhydro-N-acetylmuramic acid kinase